MFNRKHVKFKLLFHGPKNDFPRKQPLLYVNFHQLEPPKLQESSCLKKWYTMFSRFFDFVVLDHLMLCKSPWDFETFGSVKISGWDPAKSVPCCLEFCPLTKHP